MEPEQAYNWTKVEATRHLVNEAMLEIQKIIIIKQNKANPIKTWLDGV